MSAWQTIAYFRAPQGAAHAQAYVDFIALAEQFNCIYKAQCIPNLAKLVLSLKYVSRRGQLVSIMLKNKKN